MWWDKKEKKTAELRTECGRSSGNMLFIASLMFLEIFLWFINFLIVSAHNAHIKLVQDLRRTVWGSSFLFLFFLLPGGRSGMSGGGAGGLVLHYAQWKDEIMSFLKKKNKKKRVTSFLCRADFLFFFFWVLWHFYFPLRTRFYFMNHVGITM